MRFHYQTLLKAIACSISLYNHLIYKSSLKTSFQILQMKQNHLNYLALSLPSVVAGGLLAIAGNLSDGIRIFGLCLPMIFLVYFYLKTQKIILKISIILWVALFLTDSFMRALSWFLFNSDTDAHFIIEAIANTNKHEAYEFILSHKEILLLYISSLTVILCFYFFILFKRINFENIKITIKTPTGHISKYIAYFLMVAAYAIEPSRDLHPIAYWYDYQQKIQHFKSRIETHADIHLLWDKTAQKNLMANEKHHQQTHVLVITDSVTSLNLGICGYPRNTTPNLKKRLNTLQVYCNAYSPAASTIPSLKAKLTDINHVNSTDYSSKSLLAYAKNSGFRIYWLSNQNDIYISSLFGNYAHKAIYKNNRSGRSSYSLDESLLLEYEQALKDSYPKKLIILHFIGAHPNYKSRYPNNFNVFNHNTNDKVEFLLEQNNINSWIQHQRHHYDNAILYQDYLIDRLLSLLQSQVNEFSSFTFVSDHGNEVGHELNYIGHSPHTTSGYLVPIIIWYDNQQKFGVNHIDKIYTKDLDNNLMSLMGIADRSSNQSDSWFD